MVHIAFLHLARIFCGQSYYGDAVAAFATAASAAVIVYPLSTCIRSAVK
jgi:hypothetical protein